MELSSDMETEDLRRMLVDTATAFGSKYHRRESAKLYAHPESAFCRDTWSEMARLGWLGLALDEKRGGAGLGSFEASLVCETLGASLVNAPILSLAILPGAILSACSQNKATDSIAKKLAEGSELYAFASHRLVGGGTVVQLTDNGTLCGDGGFVGSASIADKLLVEAIGPEGPVLVTATMDAPGLAATHYRGGDGNSFSAITFDHVPAEIIESGKHLKTGLADGIDQARIATAAFLSGVAEYANGLFIEHMRTRVQFGHPLGKFQTLRHLAVDRTIQAELAKASWRKAAWIFDNSGMSNATRAAISAAKHRAGTASVNSALTAIQVFGGLGFAEEADCGLTLRVAQQWHAWLGSERAMIRRFAMFSKGDER